MVIRSKEDQILVKHLAKTSRKKKVNVYFNKKSSNGSTKYFTGDYFSNKNQSSFPYRSSYELAYFVQLEQDTEVVQYLYEPFESRYTDTFGVERSYRPDLMILYSNGRVLIAEVKPSAMLQDADVKSKAASIRKVIRTNYKDVNMEFKFITEKEIFKDNIEYVAFLKRVKSGEFKESK